jgi:hypothetical protein
MQFIKYLPKLALVVLFAVLLGSACSSSEHNITPGESPNDQGAATQNPVQETPLLETASATDNPEADADVVFVRAVRSADGTWTFHVTVAHPDKGWQDYADGWDVLLPDGSVLKTDPGDPFTRLLLHPHENEQPFTRSQSGIEIPEGVGYVTVRAHDLVDGFGGQEITVDLDRASGDAYQVER